TPNTSSEPIYKPKPQSQKNKTVPSFKVWLFHYIFMLSILCAYIYAIYSNRNPERPYDIAAALVNTSSKINTFVVSAGQKIKNYYEQGSWRIYLWKHIIQTNNTAMATREVEKWSGCQGLYDSRGYSLLMLTNQPAMAEILLNAGCEVNYMAPDGKTAYSLAIENKNVDLAKVLRQHGAGPWQTSKQIWKHIIQTNNLDLAEEITGNWKGCDIIFADGRSLLMTTTQPDMAQLLIKAGCDVNYVAPNGETAYTTAVKRNNLKMAQLLRNNGAQIRWKK
ncbi:MAG: ankyrin repeat domain-containing protein, partial [Alphaproteobacteria bacterium]|nr:ankyrin repeat domain-containing protein [Alphaproteobacteria bacterium]